MDLRWCILLLQMFAFSGSRQRSSTHLHLPPQFVAVFRSLSATLRSKIYHGIHHSYILNKRVFDFKDQLDCYPRLHRIMADHLKCPATANDFIPYLDILEFNFNMNRDEKFVYSWIEKNCTFLNGRDANICQRVLSGGNISVKYDLFAKMINNCLLEYLKLTGAGNESLSKRSAIKCHVIDSITFTCN